jgi:serine protease Do
MRLHPFQGFGTSPRRTPGGHGPVLFVISLLLLPLAGARADNVRRTPVVDVVRRCKGAVVNIHSERTVMAPATEELFALSPSQNRINGMGTGIIIDPRGYVVTNQHVVEDVSSLRVRLVDGTTLAAKVVARDAESDLAVLKVDAGKPLPVMPLGTSSDLMVGETVVAIGNAYGYDHTVSAGVISAVHRDVTLNKEVSYKALIQTDASINPGNSGGPLLNVHGELVGVNVAIRAGAQGIGFAIPVDSMVRVTAELLSVRKRNGVSHGLVVRDQVAELDPYADEPPPKAPRRSLVVEAVEPGGPAAHAGLQKGDVITQAGDTPVICSLDLERALLDNAAGDKVPLVIHRPRTAVTTSTQAVAEALGPEQKVELVLQAVERASAPAAGDGAWRKLGVRLQAVGAEQMSKNGTQYHGGLAVLEVRDGGPAAKAGIQRGDILIGLHQWEMLTADNVNFVLTHPDLATFSPLKFYIVRGGQVHRGYFQQLE